MRNLSRALLATAAIVGLVSTAQAADLAYRVKAPVLATPVWNWTGFYIAGQAGFGADPGTATQSFLPFGTDTTANRVGTINQPETVILNFGTAGPGVAGTTFVPLATPAGFQQISSASFSTGAAQSALYFAQTGIGGIHNIQPVTYATAPTRLGRTSYEALGGADAGYNYQAGNFVIGAAADFNWFKGSDNTGTYASNGSYSGGSTGVNTGVAATACNAAIWTDCHVEGASALGGSVSSHTDWLGTVRGKFGIAGDRAMAYVTGGMAYGRVGMTGTTSYADSNQVVGISCPFGAVVPGGGICAANGATAVTNYGTTANWAGSSARTKIGSAVGIGGAVAVTNNWFVKAEAVYYDLGRETLTMTGTSTTTCVVAATTGIVGGAAAVGQCPLGSGAGAVNAGNLTVSRLFSGVVASIGVGYKF